MTDKTSTAPVMSLQQVRDALHEAHNSPGFEAALDSCVAAIDAHLNAPTPDVVGGDVVACRYRVVAPNGNVGKWFFTDEACVSSECLEVQPLYAAPRVQGDAVAVRDALETCERWFAAHMAVAPLIGGHGHAEHPMLTTIHAALAAQPKGDDHPDDLAADAFAVALKEKLADARAKGRAGWNGDEPGMQQRLSNMLRAHVEKGDPRDVANFAMFLHQRGEAILPSEQTRGDGVDEPPLAGWWRHGNGHLSCGSFRVARADWEHEVCAAGNMRNKVFDWMCARLNAKSAPRQAVPDELIADLRKFHEETEACDEFDLTSEATAALLAANLIEGTHFVLTAKGEAMLAAAPSAGRMGVGS